jgi:nitrite reductase/ring-hydroxylating ferredoxin subunit
MSDMEDFFFALEEKDLQEGKMKAVSVEGTPILFIKQHGKIYVYDNRCPHLGCGLAGGVLHEGCVTCPCHDWCFNLETGVYKKQPMYKLVKYKWKVESGKIYVILE